MRDLSTLLAFMVGGVIITTFKYTNTGNPDGSETYSATISQVSTDAIFAIGCVQALTSFMLVVGFLVNNANLIVRAGWRERVSLNEVEMSI
jgi:undecaprenyl pyrophosphate phosphatase UppP